MASSDLYLYRKDRRWQKVSKVQEVSLTGGQTAYASVTGVASTNVVTITGASLANGMLVNFTSLSGGSGLSAGVGYYVIDASGATCKLALTQGGSAIDFTTDITAGSVIVSIDEMRVWSSEFRDTFSDTGASWYAYDSGVLTSWQLVDGQAGVSVLPNSLDPTFFTGIVPYDKTQVVASAVTASITDEKAHVPLRQSVLNRTFWKFDRGSSVSPRYLYAEYVQGDQIFDNPPETE
jgi:hypothetical protein